MGIRQQLWMVHCKVLDWPYVRAHAFLSECSCSRGSPCSRACVRSAFGLASVLVRIRVRLVYRNSQRVRELMPSEFALGPESAPFFSVNARSFLTGCSLMFACV